MGAIATSLAGAAPPASHTGKCCVLTRFLRGDLDDEDRAAVRAMIAGDLTAPQVSQAFVGIGLYMSQLQVNRHRLGYCRCCEVHGG